MSPEKKAKELEKLRKRVEELEINIGRIGDIIDRFGYPEGDEFPELEKLNDYHAEKDAKEEKLIKLVKEYRVKAPEIIETWLTNHRKTCDIIKKESGKKRDTSIRKNIVEELLVEFDEIKNGKKEIFTVNNFYLNDYYRMLRKQL